MTEDADALNENRLIKTLTGIEGFDQVTRGGLPQSRVTLIVGEPGTGKTIFALQTLANGANCENESGIFVAFEENVKQIKTNTLNFAWNIDRHEKNGKLFFIDAHPDSDVLFSGAFDLIGMLTSIKAKAQEMKATRLVFDSIDVLLRLFDDAAVQRRECYRLRQWLLENNFTCIITARQMQREEKLMEYMADCVINVQQNIFNGVALRHLNIVKYRGTGFDSNALPMVITDEGIYLNNYEWNERDFNITSTHERVSTGIDHLDQLLKGGYLANSSVLITGPSGSGKTLLASTFAEAACRHAKRTLYISFEQETQSLLRDALSIGITLQTHLDSGMLLMYSAHNAVRRIEENLVLLKTKVLQHQAEYLIIDSVSASQRIGPRWANLSVAEQIVHFAQENGIFVLLTSLERNDYPLERDPFSQISTIADTLIHLSYIPLDVAYYRTLTVLKARGTSHNSQVQEMIISDNGIALEELHVLDGRIFPASVFQEKTQSLVLHQEQERMQLIKKQHELQQLEMELLQQAENLKNKLAFHREELAAHNLSLKKLDQYWSQIAQKLKITDLSADGGT